MDKLEQVQYDATLAITGAIKCTSCSKLYKELGHESLESRRRFRCLCVLCKIVSNGLPAYLCKLIPKKFYYYITAQHFPWTIINWNKIYIKICSFTYSVFKSYLLKEIRPIINPLSNIYNTSGIKFLLQLRLSLSHLNKHKFNQHFDDCVNPFCTSSLEPESTSHFFFALPSL